MSILFKWICKIQDFGCEVCESRCFRSSVVPWWPPQGLNTLQLRKETVVRKRWRWRHLLWQSTWKRDHVTDTSEVRSHVGLRDTGEKVRTQKCSWRVDHTWFISGSVAYLRLNLYFCVFLACLFVCGLRDRRSHIFISVPVAVWRWKYARISPFSPAAFCIRVTFPGTGSGSMAVIYVSALGGVKVKISSYKSGWRSSEFWTLTATGTCS